MDDPDIGIVISAVLDVGENERIGYIDDPLPTGAYTAEMAQQVRDWFDTLDPKPAMYDTGWIPSGVEMDWTDGERETLQNGKLIRALRVVWRWECNHCGTVTAVGVPTEEQALVGLEAHLGRCPKRGTMPVDAT